MSKKTTTKKSKIHRNFNQLIIEIPTDTNWVLIVFFSVWGGLPGYWGLKAVNNLIQEFSFSISTLLNFIPILLFSIFVIIGFVMILWNIGGKETIIVTKDKLYLNKTVFNLGIKEKYDLSSIKYINYHFEPSFDPFKGVASKQTKDSENGGSIRFHYEELIIQFADNISEEEGVKILDSLKKSNYFKKEQFLTSIL